MAETRLPLTALIADYAVSTRADALPEEVRHEAVRALLNWVGVAVGGSREPAVQIAAARVADLGAAPRSSVIGQGLKTDPTSAAFVNCLAAAVLAYDDAYLPSVAHPSGPAVAAVLALAEDRKITGPEAINAIALAIEIQCRLANMLSLPPSGFHASFYVNGFSGPVGVACGVGRLIGLDAQRMGWAIGLAASMVSGFRGTHGTMTAHFRPGHAARVGVEAALLAEKGFDCTPDTLEGAGGMLEVYAPGADPAHLLDGLGSRHRMLENRYKPYPCGIVIHPSIDACLALRERATEGALRLRVNPVVLSLTGKRSPRTQLEAANSVFHWAAAAFILGVAGLPQMQMACIEDPAIRALRERIEAVPDDSLGKGEAIAELVLDDGTVLTEHVRHARGSLMRPMDDVDIEQKFRGVVEGILTAEQSTALIAACRSLPDIANVGAALTALLP